MSMGSNSSIQSRLGRFDEGKRNPSAMYMMKLHSNRQTEI